ncbi:hypothetical protein D7X88_19220 [bacterium C-53]|nr:hypothetical protein [Lachnospiraceae bacterium]NBI05037.1 hypothetical protein [Lachnospiraceae bacterium]RKJ07441.1 hypothetical protein D7X88_19220 [bacterium C-53]
MSFFSFFWQQSIKKILSYKTGYSALEYEYTYHLVCLNNSYYPRTYADMFFAVIAPYWEGGR